LTPELRRVSFHQIVLWANLDGKTVLSLALPRLLQLRIVILRIGKRMLDLFRIGVLNWSRQ
jgi:hypothetical protein